MFSIEDTPMCSCHRLKRPSWEAESARLLPRINKRELESWGRREHTEGVATDHLAIGGSPVDEEVRTTKVELSPVGCGHSVHVSTVVQNMSKKISYAQWRPTVNSVSTYSLVSRIALSHLHGVFWGYSTKVRFQDGLVGCTHHIRLLPHQ